MLWALFVVSLLFLAAGLSSVAAWPVGGFATGSLVAAGASLVLAGLAPWVRFGGPALVASILAGGIAITLGNARPSFDAIAVSQVLALAAGWEGLDLRRRIRLRLARTSTPSSPWVRVLVWTHARRFLLFAVPALALATAVPRLAAWAVSRFAPSRFAASLEASDFLTVWLAASGVSLLTYSIWLLIPLRVAPRPGRAAQRIRDSVGYVGAPPAAPQDGSK